MEENRDRESKSSRESDEAEYKVRQSPARNNKQSCFYNYSPGSTPGVKSTQVHAVPVSEGVIDRSKNKRVVRGMFRAAPQRQQPWPSPDGQPAGKCDANASGSAAGGGWQFPNFPKHTSQGNKRDQWARAKAKRWGFPGTRVRRFDRGWGGVEGVNCCVGEFVMVLAPGESTDDCVLRIPDGRPVMTMRGGEERKWQYEGGAELFSAVIRDRRCGDFGDDLDADRGKMADG